MPENKNSGVQIFGSNSGQVSGENGININYSDGIKKDKDSDKPKKIAKIIKILFVPALILILILCFILFPDMREVLKELIPILK